MRAPIAIAALTAVCLAAGPALSASAAPGLGGLEYVALGDSYSAGYGLPDPLDTPAPGCFQSPDNYPHQLADAYGLVLDDRTCSGAVTANVIDTPQVTMTGQGPAPVQSDSLSASTDIVTITIGGNDLGFATIAKSCVATSATGPVVGVPPDFFSKNTCQEIYNPSPGNDFLLTILDLEVKPALAATMATIAQKAPNAKVFVVGYPTLTPASGGCYSLPIGDNGFVPPFPQNTVPFVASDLAYLHGIEAALDDAIRAAAATAGFTYVPTFEQTADHSLCTPDPWVFGITLTNTPTPDPVPEVSGVYVQLGTLHPNGEGAANLTALVGAAIVAAFPVLPATGASIAWWVLAPLLLLAGVLALLAQDGRLLHRRQESVR